MCYDGRFKGSLSRRSESLDNGKFAYLVTVGVTILNGAHRRFECKKELRVWLKERLELIKR